jgi:hypothetical protein
LLVILSLQFIGRGCIECARTVYSQLLELFRGSQTLWIKAVQVEKEHGTRDSLDALLAQAVQACPQSDTLWLMGAKEKWLAVCFHMFIFHTFPCDWNEKKAFPHRSCVDLVPIQHS